MTTTKGERHILQKQPHQQWLVRALYPLTKVGIRYFVGQVGRE